MSGPVYHYDLVQGSQKWLQARCGVITASEMSLILTPTLKTAKNEKVRAHVYHLLAQRITQIVEPGYHSYDMIRGKEEEQYALSEYGDHCAPVKYCGFITNDKWGFKLGYSPDSLVDEDGLVEAKSRLAKYQIQTICEHIRADEADTIPAEYVMQAQAGLLIAERQWLDFISYSNGMHMPVIRVYPDEKIQEAMVEACGAFEAQIDTARRQYEDALAHYPRIFPTEYQEPGDMIA